MKILLGDCNAKAGRENIFKPTIGQESLHQDSNDNGVRTKKNSKNKNIRDCIGASMILRRGTSLDVI
jgi:hypothetical protein